MGLYVKLYEDGKVLFAKFGEEENTLDWLQKEVDGYIEVIPLRLFPGLLMVMDEEGKNNGKIINVFASMLSGLVPSDFIVGDVIIITEDGEEFVGLTPKEASALVLKLMMDVGP